MGSLGQRIGIEGKLTLVGIDKLHDPVNPGNIAWYGNEDRIIIDVVDGENSGIDGTFSDVPVAMPDPPLTTFAADSARWGEGSLGRGVFLRPNGITYDDDFVVVSLFQAAPGDTAARGKVDFSDFTSLLASGKWNLTKEQLEAEGGLGLASWPEGDFTGDQLIAFDDVAALLAAGLWNQSYSGYPTPPVKGDAATVDLIVVPGEGVYIDTNGVSISSYKITSASGSLDGDSASNIGLFRIADDSTIAGGIGFTLNGRHFLGDVLGSADVAGDISGTYTIDGVAGTYSFNVVAAVPEPGTLVMLAAGALGLLLVAIRRRRRKV